MILLNKFNLIVVCYRLSCQNLVQIKSSIVLEAAFTFTKMPVIDLS